MTTKTLKVGRAIQELLAKTLDRTKVSSVATKQTKACDKGTTKGRGIRPRSSHTDLPSERSKCVQHSQATPDDIYRVATAELNDLWRTAIGPFMDSRYPALGKEAELACEESDRVWRAVLAGKADISDFQQALRKWRGQYREQIETFNRHGHTWTSSPHEWYFERTARGIWGLRSDGRRTVYWQREEAP